MQVATLLTEALAVIGVTEIDETPDNATMASCLTSLNIILGDWSGQRTMLRAALLESFPMVAGTRTYTIGIGGAFSTDKPILLRQAFFEDSASNRFQLDVIDKSQYMRYNDALTSSGLPMAICLDLGATQQSPQLGTLSIYPIPDAAYTLYLDSVKYLTSFSALTDDVTFEPAYQAALIWGLAEYLWPKFYRNKPFPAHIGRMARTTRRTLEGMNTSRMVAAFDTPGAKGGNYDIYTDQF